SEQKDCHISVYASKTKSRVDRHFYIERELGNAIKQGLLSIKFQPIICTKLNAIASFEALVRWKCKDMGEIFPDEFISVAEKKGLIVDLGYLVLSKACHFIQQYQATHNNSVRVNVNVSVLQLLNHSFPERVKKVADEYLIDPKHIVLELTETMILDGNKNAADQLNKLSALGFQLSLDDFGAGYSSLNSFFDFPLQQIKIDKSIAWRSFTNPATFEYLSFVIKLCQAYDVDIVIEGIENAQMAQAFTDLGASYLQGYWFSKPLSFASASHYTAI
ncbi:EAL domain-containing protein, partial [Vibrio sp. 16]